MSWDDEGGFDEGFGHGPEGFSDFRDEWQSNDDWVQTDSMDDVTNRDLMDAMTDDFEEIHAGLRHAPELYAGDDDDWVDPDISALHAEHNVPNVEPITDDFDEDVWREAGHAADEVDDEWTDMNEELMNAKLDAMLDAEQHDDDTLQHPEDIQADQQDEEDEHRHDTGPGTR